VLAVLSVFALPASASTAFYYAKHPPIDELSVYERVVLDPRLVSDDEVRKLSERGVAVHAYVSIGEIEPSDTLFGQLPTDALLTENPHWNTKVVDLAHPAWHDLIFEHRMARLEQRGFGGVFLDTLDSYQLSDQVADQEQALIGLLGKLQRTHPNLELLLNRGFEVLPHLPQPVTGVVAESLFRTFDETSKEWRDTKPEDREWLQGKLESARQFAREITVIDYTDKLDEAAVETARKIRDAGYTPWVTDVSLTNFGISELIPVPRRILMLHNDSQKKLTERDLHTLFGPALDWLGYVVDFHDLQNGPPRLIKGVHAGTMIWSNSKETAAYTWLPDWLLATVEQEFPLIMLGDMPVDSAELRAALGLATVNPGTRAQATKVSKASDLLGKFEAPVRARKFQVPLIGSDSPENEIELALKLQNDAEIHPVVTGPWGGLAYHPYVVEDHGDGWRRFILDPYEFLRKTLNYSPRPVLDTTTESGGRVVTIHVDGDGFVSRAFLPGAPLSAEVLLAEFVRGYDLPHTISVIEGEIGETGLYPEQHETLEAVAREIFREPNVELASHSFSHPFFWQANLLKGSDKQLYGLHLPIPDYKLDLEREVIGSVDYINRELAPPDKRVKVFLWSGTADPDATALKLAEQAGLVNVNGGNTVLLDSDASQTNVWPQARAEHGGIQVYASIMNENVYTNNWTGPYYGYHKAIETFDLTETPRRLKPIGIYYHFYSATNPASIKALRELYDYAESHQTTPLYLSEFAERVRDYQRATIFKHIDGGWTINDLGDLRTVRFDQALGYPDLGTSTGIAGHTDVNQSRYLHLTENRVHINLTTSSPRQPYLQHANAIIKAWQRKGNTTELQLFGHAPISMTMAGARECSIRSNGHEVKARAVKGLVTLKLNRKDTGIARLVCKSA